MSKLYFPVLALVVVSFAPTHVFGQLESVDDVWAEVSRTVGAGDFDGYAATYHPDAVLVSVSGNTSYPIATALAGWKQGFDDTKDGKQEAGVEFRFSQRLADSTTAHDTGIFHYWYQPEGGEMTDAFVEFEALFVKKNGWKMIMEYQKDRVDKEKWDSLM